MCVHCSIKMRYSVAHGRSQDGEGVNPTAALKCYVYVKLAVNNFTVQYITGPGLAGSLVRM